MMLPPPIIASVASLALCSLAHVTLRRRMARRPRPSRSGTWLELAVIVRWITAVVPAMLMLLPAFELANGWPAPARWAVSIVLGALLATILANTLAGLWVLSPFVGARLGMDLVVASQRGTVTNYGWSALEMTTAAGWVVRLPYLGIAYRSWAVRRPGQPRLVVLRFHRARWSEDDVRLLRQACVLLPYRDLGAPVRVRCHGSRLAVHLALIDSHSVDAARRHVESLLAREREASPASTPPRP